MLARKMAGVLGWVRRRNLVPNSRGGGAAAGSPGTKPFAWTISNGNGLTRTIVGQGVDASGNQYTEIRFNGTSSDGSGLQIDFVGDSGEGELIKVVYEQDLVFSVGLAVVAGGTTNVSAFQLALRQSNASDSIIGSISGSDIKASLGSTLQRFKLQGRISSTSAAYVRGRLAMAWGTSAAIDFTLRVSEPNLEASYDESPPRQNTTRTFT